MWDGKERKTYPTIHIINNVFSKFELEMDQVITQLISESHRSHALTANHSVASVRVRQYGSHAGTAVSSSVVSMVALTARWGWSRAKCQLSKRL